jgi:hypothetical protein
VAILLGRGAQRAATARAGRRAGAALRRPRAALAVLGLALVCLAGALLLGSAGQLTITSNPAGAAVYLDGQHVGETPFVISTRIVKRLGRLELRAAGYAPVTQPFVVQPGDQGTLHIALLPLRAERGVAAAPQPATTSVRVESQPTGATVWLDGAERGRTPIVLEGVAPGRHELRLTAPRYQPVTRAIEVQAGKPTELSVALERVVLPDGASPPPGKPPVVVMIENHPEARPQTGLDRADVVYEALVEGGVTRFMAVYSSEDADIVGPVRSMRDYYVYWASEYRPIFAHIGGSPQSYDAVAATGIRHFEESPSYGYWRARDRYAPHNAYLNTATIRAAADRLGMLGKGAFAALVQHADWPVPLAEAARHVVIAYPGGYRVDWAYNSALKRYQRSMDGRPHRDAATGEQLTARALIIQRVATRSIDAVGRQAMDVVGQGKIAYVIDGQAGVGMWRKASPTAPTFFFDAAGERLVLPPGPLWIQIVSLETPLEWGE